MNWVQFGDHKSCRVAENLVAWVYPYMGGWIAEIGFSDFPPIWQQVSYASESAAKLAVVDWIGRTMAQFSNALAQGFEPVDDGA